MTEIQLAHGGGGEEMNELLQKIFDCFKNSIKTKSIFKNI